MAETEEYSHRDWDSQPLPGYVEDSKPSVAWHIEGDINSQMNAALDNLGGEDESIDYSDDQFNRVRGVVDGIEMAYMVQKKEDKTEEGVALLYLPDEDPREARFSIAGFERETESEDITGVYVPPDRIDHQMKVTGWVQQSRNNEPAEFRFESQEQQDDSDSGLGLDNLEPAEEPNAEFIRDKLEQV